MSRTTVIDFTLRDYYVPCNAGGVALGHRTGRRHPGHGPEPATWAMFVGGFGLAGGALRRRVRGVVAA